MTDNQSLQRVEPMTGSPTVEAMITLAVERGATVETLERLMAIRREVRAEQSKEAYDRALADFQAECPTIQKSAKVMNKDGRSVRYQYAPLDAIIHQIKGILQKHGFSYSVNAKAEPTQVTAVCKLTHANGHSESSEFAVPIDKDAYMNPAQQVASALTFAKRYAFCNACGIMTGDQDDDSQASHPPKEPTTQPTGAKQPAHAGQQASNPKSAQASQATEDQRQRWLKLLKPIETAALAYAYERGILNGPEEVAGDMMPGEPLELWPLEATPTTKKMADMILGKIQAVMDTGMHSNASEANVAPKKANSDDHREAAWYQFEMPWGKLKGTPLGELDKKYLFGLWANYEVETEYKGKPKKPETIESDQEFRDMLDEAGRYYQFEEPA